ncbi:AAA family ATPase, partial [bacterium]|nr:AAA family ATPase [bacterium]
MTNKKIVLKVAEARSRDVGRGIVRMDPKDFEGLGCEVGDVVGIFGKRMTAAKVMPTYIEDRNKGIIQIDGIIRENAQIGLDEKASIEKVVYEPARKITLSPITISGLRGEKDTRYIGRLLEGLPLVVGDRVRATLFGSKSCDFKILSATPKEGVLIIQPTTVIRIELKEGEQKRRLKISYEDIGGLGKQIQRIREMIEIPLKYPQIFERIGIDAPKGVLLHGPPGCGKTLIARAVANETDAYFTSISGPEVMAKYYGESEGRL